MKKIVSFILISLLYISCSTIEIEDNYKNIKDITPIYDSLVYDNNNLYPHIINTGYISTCHREIVVYCENKVYNRDRRMIYPKNEIEPLTYHIVLKSGEYDISYKLLYIKIGKLNDEHYIDDIILYKHVIIP